MNSSKINIFTILMFAIFMLAGVSACQKEKPESTSTTTFPEASTAKPEEANLTELMAALNMHQFKEPVQAPEFELTSVSGNKVSLSQYSGNVVLLTFWATW